MITPEEMREIIAQLDFLASDHRYVAKWATERHGEGANDESGFVVLPHNPTIGTYKRRAECLERALQAAKEHLEYCGYGDKWERECAEASKLEEQIEEALKDG